MGGSKKDQLVRLPTDTRTFCLLQRSHQRPPPTFIASRVMSQSDEMAGSKALSTCFFFLLFFFKFYFIFKLYITVLDLPNCQPAFKQKGHEEAQVEA